MGSINNSPSLYYTLPASLTNMFQSFGFAVSHLATEFGTICEFIDGSANVLFALQYTPTGAIRLIQGGTSNVLGITSGPVIVPENWNFFEMNVNTSTNTFTLRVNDATASNTPVLTVTNSDIAGTIAQLGYMQDPASFLDDLFIRDTTGSVNNSWLGDRRIATLLADADTATMGWTPNYYHQLGAGILTNTAGGGLWVTNGTPQLLGTGDFTIEGFVRFQSLPTGTNKAVIFGKWDETHNQRSYQLFLGSTALNNGCICFQTSTDGTVSTVVQPIVYPWTPALDTWYHVAIVRASGEDLLFIDGIQMGLPIADTADYFASGTYLGIGAQAELSGSPLLSGTTLEGWFDEIRWTVGHARYTANFTPTTVEFPRGSSDPYWSDVAFLAGFDSTIQDESSYTWSIGTGGSVQFTTNDGPTVGNFSTVSKSVPDDNTFMTAPYIAATSILTMTAQPTAGNTVTVGTKDGTTAAVYTFETSLSAAFQVLIDTSLQQTLQNLYNAINAGPGGGTKYGTGTTSNYDVNAVQLPVGQLEVIANRSGTSGNSIATSASGITGSWTGSTLSGGLNIPGPSNFKVQRLPPNTTLISAVQIVTRASKSDAGAGTFNTGFIGAQGGQATGPTHSLTISPVFYNDLYDVDPDTSGPISPVTITNGAIQINRDT
jgi:hypothetical protein